MQLLAVGIATLDIINRVAAYPEEDQELRALDQHLVRGGNATNTLVVLSQLGHRGSWAGTLADEPDSELILQDLTRYGIDTSACRRFPGKSPTSYVLLSQATGSRTIVHYRNLPEYSAQDFYAIDSHAFDWIHFEGRNVQETLQMMQRLKQTDPRCRVSLELEKSRPGIERLIPYADVLLCGRGYALARGYADAVSLFAGLRESGSQALLFCAWGEQGAWAQTAGAEPLHRPAQPPVRLVDSLGAGDVFNAAVIHGLLQKLPLADVLAGAVQMAGIKCGQLGLDRLVKGDV